jgi:methanogenic corrinoid protein MtbC1
MTSPIGPDLVEVFLGLIESRSVEAATRLALGQLEAGHGPGAVILDLLVPAQREVGERWQRGVWTVADEHLATAVADAALHELATAAGPRATDRGSLAVVCAEGDWHALPSRMAAELLRLDGWEVLFLGGSVPAPDLRRWLSDAPLDAVVVTCSVPTLVRGVLRLASAVAPTGVPIVAGGAGMGPDGARAAALGVRWAGELDGLGLALAAEIPAPDPRDLQERIRADQDAQLRRDELVKAAMRELRRTWPAMAGYGPAQLDRTAEDLGHILDAAAAAALTSDPRLLADFLAWVGEVLRARDVPTSALTAGLHALCTVSPTDAPALRQALGTAVPDPGLR